MTVTIADWPFWESCFADFLRQHAHGADAAHDSAHIQRVVANARQLAQAENVSLEVVLPAAWLHDCVAVPKDSPQRSAASRMAAQAAGDFLHSCGYPEEYIPAVQHAIEAHSFTARIEPHTIEAKVVQDADRLDSLGAVGIARTLMLGGAMGKPLYDLAEPLPISRQPNDRLNTIDHFYTKLLTLADTMQTAPGRVEAQKRTAFMRAYLQQLAQEIGANEQSAERRV